MEMNRHHYFLLGLVILFAGLQFRMVESFVLNEDTTRFVSEKLGSSTEQASVGMFDAFTGGNSPVKKSLKPPVWVGWALVSVGSVLILHALSMPKPGG